MQEFTNSHLSYDEIITDSEFIQQQQPTRETRLKLRPERHKPFWIERNKQMQTTTTHRIKHNESLNSLNEGGKNINPEENRNKYQEAKIKIADEIVNQSQLGEEDALNQYESDFQFLEEDIEESIVQQVHLSVSKQTNKSCQLVSLRKNNNYSAVLPRIQRKLTKVKNQDRKTVHQRESNSLNNICKSTLQLREQNKKLVHDIQLFRKYLPIFKKNHLILHDQDQQLSQIRQRYTKFFDINYELSLDKNVQGNIGSVLGVQGKIKNQQKLIKHPFLKNKMHRHRNVRLNLKISRVGSDEQQYSPVKEFVKIREHVLCKKREQDQYEKKIVELEDKIKQYYQILTDLQQRSRVGIHEQLKRKKIVLQYDIQMKKTQIQQKQCQLMLQISELNNKSSEMQIQSAKLTAELCRINRQKLNSKLDIITKRQINNINENENVTLKISEQPPPKKQMTKLLKLFGRKK